MSASPAASRWLSAIAWRCWRVLCDAGYEVSLETSGALPVAEVDPRVRRVVDVKTPASGEQARNLLDQLGELNARDQIKFVICDRGDYEWSRALLSERGLHAARHGAVFPQLRAVARTTTGRLDTRGPSAGAAADAAAQGVVGQ